MASRRSRFAAMTAPGQARRLELRGPAGAAALLLAALEPARLAVTGLSSPRWIDVGPSLVALPVATTGQRTPAGLPITVPPLADALGVTLHAQAVFPGLRDALAPAGTFASNPANLVPRP